MLLVVMTTSHLRTAPPRHLHSGPDDVHGVGDGGGGGSRQRSGHSLKNQMRTVAGGQFGQLLCGHRHTTDVGLTRANTLRGHRCCRMDPVLEELFTGFWSVDLYLLSLSKYFLL